MRILFYSMLGGLAVALIAMSLMLIDATNQLMLARIEIYGLRHRQAWCPSIIRGQQFSHSTWHDEYKRPNVGVLLCYYTKRSSS